MLPKLLIAGIISSVVAICINGLASFPFKNPATLLLFWANVSFIGGTYRKRAGEKKINVSYPLLKAYLFIFTITGLILSYKGLKASRYMFLASNTEGKTSLQFAEKTIKPLCLILSLINVCILSEQLLCYRKVSKGIHFIKRRY